MSSSTVARVSLVVCAVFSLTGLIGCKPGPTHLEIVATTPVAADDDVFLDSSVEVEFAEGTQLDSATVTTDSFYLYDTLGAQKVVGVTSVSGDSITFVPSSPLRRNSSYVGTVTHEVSDDGGVRLPETFTWEFSTLAALGELDSSFNGTGVVRKSFASGHDSVRAVAVTSNDAILVAGQMGPVGGETDGFVARYTADGEPDTSFGSSGVVTYDLAGSLGEGFSAIAIQPDGKIVVAGHYIESNGDSRLLVVRYTAGGSPDSSFGVAGVFKDAALTGDVSMRAVDIAPSGAVVAAGYDSGFGRGVVVSIRSDGSDYESGFNGGSPKTIEIGSFYPLFRDVEVLSNGSILAIGDVYATDVSQDVFCVVKLTSTGALDAGFGDSGVSLSQLGTDDTGWDAAVLSSGAIFGVGTTLVGGIQRPFAIQLTGTGSLDSSVLGGTGATVLQFTTASEFRSVAVQRNGKPVAAGYVADGSTARDSLVMRFMPTGDLDGSFGGGTGYIAFASSTRDDEIQSLAIQSTGRIIGGGAIVPDAGTTDDSYLVGIW